MQNLTFEEVIELANKDKEIDFNDLSKLNINSLLALRQIAKNYPDNPSAAKLSDDVTDTLLKIPRMDFIEQVMQDYRDMNTAIINYEEYTKATVAYFNTLDKTK